MRREGSEGRRAEDLPLWMSRRIRVVKANTEEGKGMDGLGGDLESVIE